MATMNTSSQTNSQEYGHTQAVNYYQVFLKNGNRVIMGSQIFTNYDDVNKLVGDIYSQNARFIVSYVSGVPNLGMINHNLQQTHQTTTGSYNAYPMPSPELNVTPEPPQTPDRQPDNSAPPPVGRFKTYSFSSPEPSSRGTTASSTYEPPLPHNSYFSSEPELEVVGKGISKASEDDLWEHLSGEKDNMTESFVEGGPNLFDGMTLEEYGRGYLLKPPSDHPDFGTKYYHDAWWRADLQGWFLKQKYLDYFLNNGALWNLENEEAVISEPETDDDDELDRLLETINESDALFNDMVFEPYGPDGYLLQCYNSHPDYKKREYHGGVWHRQGDGWYFPKEYRNFLEDNGAVFEYDEGNIFKGMDFNIGVNWGQFYLSPSLDSRFYGLNVFEVNGVSGIWCHQKESWRFEGVNEKFFTDRGAGRTSWH